MSAQNAETSPLLAGSTNYETALPINLNGDSIETRVYAKRWGVLFVFSFLSVMNNLTQYSFSPISLITQDYYDVSSLKVNLLAVITGFTTRFVAMWIIDNKGLGTGIFIASILNLVGSWVRWFPGYENYYWLLLGQSICAIAQSFIDIAGPKIAANWFPPKERTTATAFSQGPIFISLLMAYAIVPHAVKPDTVKHDLPLYLFVEAILTSVSTVLIFLFFRGEPPHPPSYSAASDKLQFKQAFKILLRKKNFLIMFFVFGITLGSALAFSVLMEQVITPAGYTTTDASTLGSVWIAFAIIGGFLGGPIIDRTRAYKSFIILTLSLSTLGTVCFTLVLQFSKPNVPLLCVIIAFTGLGGAGFPAILEGTIETIYPVPEATAMGILFLGLNVTGVVFVLLMEQLKDPKTGSMIKSMWGVVFLCLIGISAVFFFKSDYRRLHFERQVAQRKEEKKDLKGELDASAITPYTSFHA